MERSYAVGNGFREFPLLDSRAETAFGSSRRAIPERKWLSGVSDDRFPSGNGFRKFPPINSQSEMAFGSSRRSIPERKWLSGVPDDRFQSGKRWRENPAGHLSTKNTK